MRWATRLDTSTDPRWIRPSAVVVAAVLAATSCAVAPAGSAGPDLPPSNISPAVPPPTSPVGAQWVAVLDVSGRPEFFVLDGSGRFPAGEVRAVSRNPRAVSAGELRSPASISDDPRSGEQWGLRRVGAVEAWNRSTGAGVRVAVLDTGVAAGHEDLAHAVISGFDALAGSAGNSRDPNGHGTHVAGIIAAARNNGVGVAGLAPEVTVLPVKVLDAGGSGDHVTIASGIVWAVDNGAQVLNLSLGGPEDSEALAAAIRYAVDRDVAVVAAAGNNKLSGNAPNFPAAYPGVVGVGASGPDDSAAMFSYTGPHVDLVAPGFGVVSTIPGGYGYLSGTSQAAPLVAAAVALRLARHPGSPRAAADAVVRAAADVGPAGADQLTGAGVLDASVALGGPRTEPPLLKNPGLPPLPGVPTLDPSRPPVLEPPTLVAPTFDPLPPVDLVGAPDLPAPPPSDRPAAPGAPALHQGVLLVGPPRPVRFGETFDVSVGSVGCVGCTAELVAPGSAPKSIVLASQPQRESFIALQSGPVALSVSGREAAAVHVVVEPSATVTVTRRARAQADGAVAGTVMPASRRLNLERLDETQWVVVARTDGSSGRFSFNGRFQAGVYRVVVVGGELAPMPTFRV
jgi:serine protease